MAISSPILPPGITGRQLVIAVGQLAPHSAVVSNTRVSPTKEGWTLVLITDGGVYTVDGADGTQLIAKDNQTYQWSDLHISLTECADCGSPDQCGHAKQRRTVASVIARDLLLHAANLTRRQEPQEPQEPTS